MDNAEEHIPRWYQEAIIYELHVRAFFDSNKDGSGDFRGLIQKLDYLQNLGVTAIWLLPFYPSPLRDDGYDISDYTNVHPTYGNLADFKLMLREAHRRNIRVITELVVNHTSDQHPWFQRARRAKPGSQWRDFYVWSNTTQRFEDARIIFQDFESSNWTWDPVAQAYYWHRFYANQPDLNFDNPLVQKAVQQWLDFWLNLGVDGLRLDAIPYLYKREGTNCENLPETHAFLKKIRQHINEKYADRMLLAEANQWPEDAVTYFGNGDECHMAFHFPLMPRMFMALQMEDRFPLVDILQQTPEIPSSCQWCIFLRNHDELTLEMVTDEERDYMYQVYAQDPQARVNLGIRRRLAPLLNSNRKKIELMNALLFAIPGTPVIYYGDEIGMGDNYYLGDRNAVRTPMQWNADRNAGFSTSHAQSLFLPIIIDPEYHYESVNVDTQEKNPESLLWWMKRLIALRKRYPALALGKIQFLFPENPKVLAFTTSYKDQTLLIVANFSRFSEYVELDLSDWEGNSLLELFGQSEFPAVTGKSYFLSLGPHAFYWFLLKSKSSEISEISESENPIMEVAIRGSWDRLLKESDQAHLESILLNYLPQQRWFGRKNFKIKQLQLEESLSIFIEDRRFYLLFVEVIDVKDQKTIYFLPITSIKEQDNEILKEIPQTALIAKIVPENEYLIDASFDQKLCDRVIKYIARGQKIRGKKGILSAQNTSIFKSLALKNQSADLTLLSSEQTNTSIKYGTEFILKYYRRCQAGVNPEIEIGQFLTEKQRFPYSPAFAGCLEYIDRSGKVISLAVLHQFIQHETDGWQYTLDHINRFFEKILTENSNLPTIIPHPELSHNFFENEHPIPEEVKSLLGNYIYMVNLLGQHTAELHIVLASNAEELDFAPEVFSTFHQRALYQSIRSLVGRTFSQLKKATVNLDGEVANYARKILDSSERVDAILRKIINRKISGLRIRSHGDFHLGQVIFTGKDFMLVDFEGEPERSLSERRIKRSPLVDVAGMLRSFHYAAMSALFGPTSLVRKEDIKTLESWANFWNQWVRVCFLNGYFSKAKNQSFLPKNQKDFALLLKIFMLEKAVYEINYELNNRPEWLEIPCRGLVELLE